MRYVWVIRGIDHEHDSAYAASLYGKVVTVNLWDGREIVGTFERLSAMGVHLRLPSGDSVVAALEAVKTISFNS